ncbi:hypothetical protein A943_01840 [Bacillus sp. CPSM8]|nr:hypothetical protein A943_01840 [Bacillus sp. CPSM8]TWK45185.1 hypothetical protein CHCC20348_2833 [Bacillus paralicheniformis]TWK85825.1 hypothetical protein CHCC20331_0978 [Bacillus paralicheniformis]
MFYKAKNASAHRRSVFLVFAAANRLTRLSVKKHGETQTQQNRKI